MKYSYFCPGKAGKYLLRDMFLLNNRTTFLFHCGEIKTMWATAAKPNGQFHWYWEDDDGKLVTTSHKVNEDFLLNHHYSECWYYIPTDGKYIIQNYLKRPEVSSSNTCAGDFNKCFSAAADSDLIVNPLVMLGYGGRLGCNKLAKLVRNRDPNLVNIPIDYVVDELNKRKNMVTHKEDLRQLARNYFIGNGHLPYKQPNVYFTDTTEKYVQQVTKQINTYRQFEQDIVSLLDYYNIKYEWYNLDTDNYKQRFKLDQVYDKEFDPHHRLYDFIEPTDVIEEWIDDYVRNNR